MLGASAAAGSGKTLRGLFYTEARGSTWQDPIDRWDSVAIGDRCGTHTP